ncbi:MAG: AAA family ATPase [Bacilli bacterium]|nr:AAA family ATPase [Bacilli bacterium]
MENYIKNTIYQGREELYENLVSLSKSLQNITLSKHPILMEFIGSCRSGKTTSIALIQDILIKHGVKVLVIDEEYIKLTKEINHNRDKKMNIDSLGYTNQVIEEKILGYDATYNQNYDFIIYDRGINDEFVWLNVFDAPKNSLTEYTEKLNTRKVDFLFVLICTSKTTLERKYLNSLSIMPSKWTNEETLTKYLASLNSSKVYFKKHSANIFEVDTTNISPVSASLKICHYLISKLK